MNEIEVLWKTLREAMTNLEGKKIAIQSDRYFESYGISKDEPVNVLRVEIINSMPYVYIVPKPDSEAVREWSAISFGIYPHEFIILE